MNRHFKLFGWAAVATVATLAAPFGCSSSSSPTSGSGVDSGTQNPVDSSTDSKRDSSSGTPDSSTPPNDSQAPPGDGGSGAFAGMYYCMLTGTAQVSILGGAPMPQTLPLNSELTVTETGSAVSATLTTEGGAMCTLTFADQGNGTALIDPGQSCMFPVTMPIATTVTITFVAAAGDDAGPPGAATLAGNTITPNLPFHLTAVGGAASGEGDLTGTCTKM